MLPTCLSFLPELPMGLASQLAVWAEGGREGSLDSVTLPAPLRVAVLPSHKGPRP